MMHRLSWLGFGAVASLVVVAAVALAQDQRPTEDPSQRDQVRPRPRPIARPVPLPTNTRFVILYNESETPQELVKEFQQYLKDLQNPSQTRPNQTQQSQGKPQDSAQSDRNGDDERQKFREFLVKHRNSTPPNQPVVLKTNPQQGGLDCSRSLCVLIKIGSVEICICIILDNSVARPLFSQSPVPPNTIIFVMGEELVKQLEQANAEWWQENVFAKIPAGGRPEPVALTIKPGSIPR